MTMPEAAPYLRGDTLVFEQRAKMGEFLGLSLRNGLLNIVTLTLYRFWGKTEVRRRVWGSTFLNGEAFEYTGRGMELFLGFLIAALAIGLPFLLVVFGAQMMGPAIAALIITPLYLALFWLIGVGMFTAFRYMASRTVWRGVRFQLRGSAASYGLAYMGYLMLSGITMGWFWPEAQRNLAEKIWGGLSFGDRKLKFDAAACRREGVYGAFAFGWFGTIGLYILMFVVIGLGGFLLFRNELGGPPKEPSLAFLVMIYAVMLVMLVFVTLIYAPFQAAMLRSVVSGIRFDEARFRLAVRAMPLAWLTISNVVLAIVTLGFLMPYVQARTARFLISRLSSEGTVDLGSIRQAATGPRTGEGLADAFGLAPI